MKREELKQHAQSHYADIKVRLREDTDRAIINSEIFGPNLPFPQKPRETHHNTFYLKDQDSVSCLFGLTDRSKTAILNYASYKHPGGYFLGGSWHCVTKATFILFFLLLMILITHGIDRD